MVELVTEWLQKWWSPEQIASRLRLEFPGDPMMWVSHETIYQSLFVEGRGELRRELHRCCALGEPHSPWQRASDENTNGPLRQYFPKGTHLGVHSAEDLARAAASLNNRPRKTLGYMAPSEKLVKLLALTG